MRIEVFNPWYSYRFLFKDSGVGYGEGLGTCYYFIRKYFEKDKLKFMGYIKKGFEVVIKFLIRRTTKSMKNPIRLKSWKGKR